MLTNNVQVVCYMRAQQKYSHRGSIDATHETSAYSKNPRFKIQKLLKSRIVEFSQKCLLMKSYGSANQEEKHEQKIKRPGTLTLKPTFRPTRFLENQQSLGTQKKSSRRSYKTQFDIQTIDVIKDEISKTLIKDLLSLKGSDDQHLPIKNKNSMKIKLLPKKNTALIGLNQSQESAQAKFQQELILNSRGVDTPKPQSGNNHKIMPPLIYFLKRKQLSERNMDPMLGTERKRSKRYSMFGLDRNSNSERKRSQYIEELRESQYSPWESNPLGKNIHNIEISQVLFEKLG